MLLRFFRPRWQHPNAEVRLKAVSAIEPGTPQQDDILKSIAREDEHPDVRFEALLKVNDLNLILAFGDTPLHGTKQLSYQQHLCNHLTGTANVTNIEQAIQLLKQQEDLLLHLVIHAKDKTLQLKALDTIDSQKALAAVVRSSHVNVQCRRESAARIQDIEFVETLAKELQGKDKQTYRTLKAKLDAHKEQLKQAETAHQACAELVDKIEHLSNAELTQYFDAKYQALKKQWAPLADKVSDHQLLHRGDVALSQCEVRFLEQQQQQQREKEKLARIQQAQETQSNLINDLDKLMTKVTGHVQSSFVNESPTDLQNEVEAELDALNQMWTALDTPPISKVRIQFEQKTDTLKTWMEAIQRFDGAHTQLEQLTTDKDASKQSIQDVINRVNWPTQLALPAPLSELSFRLQSMSQQAKLEKEERHAKKQKDYSGLKASFVECEKAVTDGQSRDASRLLKAVEKQVQSLGRLPNDLDQTYKNLIAQVRSLESWSGYAAEPKKLALCEQMEALIDLDAEADVKAEKIKELQKQWRLIDSTDPVHSHSLWNRFKKASDKAYEPCEVYFTQQRMVRKENLALREQLIEELSSALDQQDWSNWTFGDAAELLTVSRKTWREYRPVDRSPGKKSQNAFDNVCKRIEDHLSSIREKHHVTKTELLQTVTELSEKAEISSEDLEVVKQLQAQWKQLGRELPHQDRKLWKQFKANCNKVFDTFKGDQAKYQSLASAAEELDAQLNKAISTPTQLATLSTLLQQVKELTANSALDQGLGKQLELQAKKLKRIEAHVQSLQTPEHQAIERFAVLCQQLENAIVEDTSSVNLESFTDAWQSGIRAPAPYQAMLDDRFEFAQAAIAVDDETLRKAVLDQEKRIRHLCIRVEIALGLSSPEEDQALRMEYQMERLQQSLSQKDQSFDITDIIHLEYEWLCIPFAAHYEDLSARFHQALEHMA